MIENLLSIVIMSVLIVWVVTDIIIDKQGKRAYVICAFLFIAVVLAEICCTVFENTAPDNRLYSIIGNLVGFAVAPFIFTLESCIYEKKHIYLRLIPAIVNLPLVFLSPYTGWFFYVDENNIYSRGPLYFLFMAIFVFSIILSLAVKIKTLHFLPGYFKLRTILSCIIMLAGMTFQLIFPQYHSTWIIICVFFILDYAILCEINSMVDGLTGLLNKIVFNKQIELMQVTKQSNYYILVLDVNNFKKINDNKGHLYGDMCLCEIALVLKSVFKKRANIFRFGGDEFCVLLNVAQDTEIEQYVQALICAFANSREKLSDFPYVAVGYEKFQVDILPSETIDAADFNMYTQKSEIKKMFDNRYEGSH